MEMVPKIIHYCWFGGNPLTEEAQRCINSWKKYLPDYEIKEWNEENFDTACCRYVAEAYREKKWAFVSDFARFDILYRYGGVYFDTDVELISPMESLVETGPFMGIEKSTNEVAPGLGMAAYPGMEVYREILCMYQKSHFINTDGSINQIVVSKYTTEVLHKYGFTMRNEMQAAAGIHIYPSDFFCPVNYNTGECVFTQNTKAIHHYAGTWQTAEEQKIQKFKQNMAVRYGDKAAYILERLYSAPYRAGKKFSEKGVWGTLRWIGLKLKNSVRTKLK